MLPKPPSAKDHKQLRARAVTQLRGPGEAGRPYAGAPDALSVLYDLASSPATAPKAMALLHELQVHQVELDLQDEELRRTRRELEMALARQMQLYDCAPVAYLTIDADTTLREANLTAERVFGMPRALLPGRKLASLLLPDAGATLQGMLARLGPEGTLHATLRLAAADGSLRAVHASVSRDPAGEDFLLVIAASDDPPTA